MYIQAPPYSFRTLNRRLAVFFGSLLMVALQPAVAQQGGGAKPPEHEAVILRDNFFPITPVEGLVKSESAMRAGLLYDGVSKKIVWEKDMHYAYPIASLTKMMVALLVVEDVLNCRADWSDEVVMTRRLYKWVRKRRVYYTVSETYTLDGLLHLAMIPSHNEACNTIARHLGGTVDDFVARMNERARQLNMNNTFYSNPSGLPARRDNLDNNSSPADMLLLALECLKYPEIINISKIGYAEVANDKSKSIYRNHNRLVIDYENEVDGLKTGYTRNAKYCLVATSGKNNHRMISVVLGCRSTWQRNAAVEDMLSNYYERIGIGRLGSSAQAVAQNDNKSVGGPVGESTLPSYTYKTVWTSEKYYHRIRSGENLSSIAQRYGCSVRSLKRWNHLRSSRIYAGRNLALYKSVKKKVAIKEEEIEKGDSEEESLEESDTLARADGDDKEGENSKNFQQKPPVSSKGQYIYHTVQRGDTLWHIAKRYKGVTVEQIKRINNIGNSRSLMPGTKLKIKVSS